MKALLSKILDLIGYYRIKAQIRRKQQIRQYQREDKLFREEIDAKIHQISSRILPQVQEKKNLTVSLTTHGERVGIMAPYAIYGILEQSLLPNRIVLNINQDKWSEDNLPELIKKLMIAGLEVNFCEDVGPHTKYLPALEKYPEDIIVTIDDDVYYDKDMLKAMLQAAEATDFKQVICNDCVCVERDVDGNILPYSKWKPYSGPTNKELIPLGFRGVLYPPHIFSSEIFNKEVYRSICKSADDIWFGLTELREHIAVTCTNSPERQIRDIDRLNEYFAEGSDALHFINNESGRNDVQSKAVVEYYSLK